MTRHLLSTEAIGIRRAQSADAAALAAFAARSFRETYARHLAGPALEAYIADSFVEARQAAEIGDPDAQVLLAEVEGELVGYAYLRFGTQPGSVTFDYPAELARLYVDREAHGRGVAQALLTAARAAAQERGAATLWLAVWPENERAMAFYRKEGFARAGAQPFRLGDEIQLDDVLAQPLG